MRNTILILFIISLAIISSCKSENQLIIEGFVYHAKTRSPLSGVRVTLKTGTEKKALTATTDGDGFYSLGEVLMGEYIVVFEKDSFLADMTSVGLSGTYIISDVTMKQTISTINYLSELTESAKINIFKRYNFQVTQAARYKDYTVYLSPAMDPIKGQTDSEGLLELTNMPGSSSITLSFDFTDDGVLYRQDFNLNLGFNKPSSLVIEGKIETGGDLGLVHTNVINSQGESLQDFKVNESIIIRFTQPIDIENASISLQREGISDVNTVDSWSNNNMQITMTPINDLMRNTNYSIRINVTNEDLSDSYNLSVNFHTEE